MASDIIPTPEPRLSAYAVIESDTYPLVELRTIPKRGGGIEYTVRCFSLDPVGPKDFDGDKTECPRHARMMFMAASGGVDLEAAT